jgi:hypothetical protein
MCSNNIAKSRCWCGGITTIECTDAQSSWMIDFDLIHISIILLNIVVSGNSPLMPPQMQGHCTQFTCNATKCTINAYCKGISLDSEDQSQIGDWMLEIGIVTLPYFNSCLPHTFTFHASCSCFLPMKGLILIHS